jgi:probable phosphoglycerate mutase
LIRHADAAPEPEAQLEASTSYDALGLSAKGARQAAALARRLASGRTPLVAIYASPTRRALETAETLAGALNLPVNLEAALREIYLGDLSPGNVPPVERSQAIRARLDDLADIALRHGSWNAVPDAEPAARVRKRVSAAVEAIVERHAGMHVALVSHAGTINAYLAGVIGAGRDFFFLAGNTSLSSVVFADGAAMLVRLNDTAHLEPSALV